MITPLTLYDGVAGKFFAGGLDVGNAKLALLAGAYTPDTEHELWSEVSAHEMAATTGYDAGGKAVGSTVTQSGDKTAWNPADLTFTALDASFAYGVLYSGTNLIGYINFSGGAEITITGYDFVVRWAAPGIIEMEEI